MQTDIENAVFEALAAADEDPEKLRAVVMALAHAMGRRSKQPRVAISPRKNQVGR